MINQDKYEKINGREALKRLLDGENVYSCEGERYRLDPSGNLYYIPNPTHHENLSFINIREVLSVNWYIPKPFDVRQSMRERPNEWVAAYKSGTGKWFKIGFNTDAMKAVIEEIECDRKPFWKYDSVRPGILQDCIPIEDVPVNER